MTKQVFHQIIAQFDMKFRYQDQFHMLARFENARFRTGWLTYKVYHHESMGERHRGVAQVTLIARLNSV